MKQLCFLVFLIFISNISLAQHTKTLTFHNFHKALPDVNIFYNGKFITSSDFQGIVEVQDSIDIIRCNYLGIFDTVIEINYKKDKIINLSINLLGEVSVLEKYDAKSHLIKLLKKNDSIVSNAKIDTSLYYKVFLKRTMLEIDKVELFEGIVKLSFKRDMSYAGWGSYSCIIVKIDNYYNDISQFFTAELPSKDKFYAKIPKISLNLYPHYKQSNIEKVRKKYKVENIYQQNDSIIFKLSYKEKKNKNRFIEQRSYYFFVNNIIIKVDNFFDYDKNRGKILGVFDFTNLYKYEITDYQANEIISCVEKKSKYETYYNNINQTLVTEFLYKAIPNPKLDFEINETYSIANYLPTLIKKKYLDLIIPSSTTSVYKMSF